MSKLQSRDYGPGGVFDQSRVFEQHLGQRRALRICLTKPKSPPSLPLLVKGKYYLLTVRPW